MVQPGFLAPRPPQELVEQLRIRFAALPTKQNIRLVLTDTVETEFVDVDESDAVDQLQRFMFDSFTPLGWSAGFLRRPDQTAVCPVLPLAGFWLGATLHVRDGQWEAEWAGGVLRELAEEEWAEKHILEVLFANLKEAMYERGGQGPGVVRQLPGSEYP